MPLTSATICTLAQIAVPKTIGNFLSGSLSLAFGGSAAFASGSIANQANQVYAGTRTVTSGTPDSIDTQSLLQPDGSAFAATDIVAIGIKNNGTAGQILTVGGGSTPVVSAWVTTLVIPPGAQVVITNPAAAGYAINASTAHLIQVVVAAGTAVPYDIFILSH
jgi:hypothetical protein